MIYTIGYSANLQQAIAKDGPVKQLDGYAFKTLTDAFRMICEINHLDDFCIFGLDADWENDTTPSTDGWWHDLINDANIIVLNDDNVVFHKEKEHTKL